MYLCRVLVTSLVEQAQGTERASANLSSVSRPSFNMFWWTHQVYSFHPSITYKWIFNRTLIVNLCWLWGWKLLWRSRVHLIDHSMLSRISSSETSEGLDYEWWIFSFLLRSTHSASWWAHTLSPKYFCWTPITRLFPHFPI